MDATQPPPRAQPEPFRPRHSQLEQRPLFPPFRRTKPIEAERSLRQRRSKAGYRSRSAFAWGVRGRGWSSAGAQPPQRGEGRAAAPDLRRRRASGEPALPLPTHRDRRASGSTRIRCGALALATGARQLFGDRAGLPVPSLWPPPLNGSLVGHTGKRLSPAAAVAAHGHAPSSKWLVRWRADARRVLPAGCLSAGRL
jgi:hypothetical protein